MFFLTEDQCHNRIRSISLDAGTTATGQPPAAEIANVIRIDYSGGKKVSCYLFARRLVSIFEISNWWLLWITEFGIWPSSENQHLYYLLRQHFHNYTRLKDHPGHDFLGYEVADLVTFLEIVITYGWGGLLASSSTTRARISHDEYILL